VVVTTKPSGAAKGEAEHERSPIRKRHLSAGIRARGTGEAAAINVLLLPPRVSAARRQESAIMMMIIVLAGRSHRKCLVSTILLSMKHNTVYTW
jgi:hypothetical protein